MNIKAFYRYTADSGVSEDVYFARDFSCIYPISRRMGDDNFSEIKELVNFVSDADDSMFAEMFDSYFDKEYTIRYFLMTYFVGAVDNLGKNMKLCRFKNNGKWYPMFYDLDTTIGLDNSGFLKFTDSDIEMTSGVFNTSKSNLWVKLQRVFYNDIVTEYSKMRLDRFTLDNIMKYVYGEQIAKIPERYYNMDMQTKYLQFGSQYLYACHGDSYQHIKKWLTERLAFMDTLFNYTVSSSDYITIRANKLGYVYMDIQTYIPLYVTVKWRNDATGTGIQTLKVGKGETVRFSTTLPTATDQEIVIYGGQYLKDLGDLSNLAPTTMLISNAYKLTKVKCSSPNLINTDLSQLRYLREIDLHGCTMLGTGVGTSPTLNISDASYLTKIDIRDTKLTALYTNPNGGNLQEIYYPESIQEIELANQKLLKMVGIPYGYRNVWGYQRPIENMQYNFTDVEILTELRGSFAFKDYSEVSDEKTYTIKADEYGFETSIYEFDENKNKIGSQTLSMNTTDNTSLIYTPSPGTKFININLRNTRWDGYGDLPSYFSSYRFTESTDINEFVECKLLNRVSMKNLTEVEYTTSYSGLDYKNIEGFYSFRYVQNLTLNNSMKLTAMNFDGFHSMKNVEIISMNTLTDLGFNNMVPVDSVSTIKSITVSDCKKIENIELNVTSEDYSVSFADDAILDLSKAATIKNIYSNCVIKGLKTIILPMSIESLYFTQEYGTGTSTIKNIWSPIVNHTNDGYIGMDLTGINLKNLDMSTLLNISTCINFSLSPTDVAPRFNIGRDGVLYKFFQPEGVINLTDYTAGCSRLFEGLDMNKIQIICDKNLEQDDFSYCFHNSLVGNGDVISNFINRMKNVKNMTGIFESSDINNLQFLRSIPMNNGMITDYAFKDCIKIQSANNMTIGSNVKSAIGSFKGCTGIKTMTGLQINMSGPISNFAQGCTSLTTITGTVKNVTNMDYMYDGCEKLTGTLDCIPDTCKRFAYAYANTAIKNLRNFSMYNAGDSNTIMNVNGGKTIFSGTNIVTIEDCYFNYDIGGIYNDEEWSLFMDKNSLTSAKITIDSNCTSMRNLFRGTNVSEVSVVNGNYCNNIQGMFYNDYANNLTLSMDTSNVRNMSFLFSYSKFTEINYGEQWNTSNVITMQSMYEYAYIKNIDMTTWDTHSLCEISSTFKNSKVENINMSGINTESINGINKCFYQTINLITLNMSGCNFNALTNLTEAFSGVRGTANLDLSNCNFGNIMNTNSCYLNGNIDLSNSIIGKTETEFSDNFMERGIISLNLDGAIIRNKSFFKILPFLTDNNKTVTIGAMDLSGITDFTSAFESTYLGSVDFSQVVFNTAKTVNLNFDYAFRNSDIQEDIIFPNNTSSCREAFKDCLQLTSIHSNWNTQFLRTIVPDDCYLGCENVERCDGSLCDGLDEVPKLWGGYDFNKDRTFIFEVDSSLLTDSTFSFDPRTYVNQIGGTAYCSTNWGDGTIDTEISHTYETPGIYKIKTHRMNGGRGNLPYTKKGIVALYQVARLCGGGDYRNLCYECKDLQKVELNFLPNNAKLNYAFCGCNSLTKFTVREYEGDIASLINIFEACTSLVTLDLSNMPLSENCDDISNIVRGCSALTSFRLPQIKGVLKNAAGLCAGLRSMLDYSFLNDIDDSNITNIKDFFLNNSTLTQLPVEFTNKSFPLLINLEGAFSRCTNLINIDLSNITSTNVSDISHICEDCSSLQTFKLNPDVTYYFSSVSYAFKKCSELISVQIPLTDFSAVTNLVGMHQSCSKLIDLNMPFTGMTSNITDMTGFLDSPKLKLTQEQTNILLLVAQNVIKGKVKLSAGLYPLDGEYEITLKDSIDDCGVFAGNVLNTGKQTITGKGAYIQGSSLGSAASVQVFNIKDYGVAKSWVFSNGSNIVDLTINTENVGNGLYGWLIRGCNKLRKLKYIDLSPLDKNTEFENQGTWETKCALGYPSYPVVDNREIRMKNLIYSDKALYYTFYGMWSSLTQDTLHDIIDHLADYSSDPEYRPTVKVGLTALTKISDEYLIKLSNSGWSFTG